MMCESETYELRLYDQVLVTFRMSRGTYGDVSAEVLNFDATQTHLLPLSFAGKVTHEILLEWLQRRRVPKNRAYVDEILRSCGIASGDIKSILDVSRGLSLNDAFWVVPASSPDTFATWNLYDNELNTALQLAAYTGIVSDALADGGVPSELTNSGMFPKAWRTSGTTRLLYKAGHLFEGANVGKEPYSEYLAWQIAARMGLHAIRYDLDIWRESLCSTCALFSSKSQAFVPFGFALPSAHFKSMNLRNALAFFAHLGAADFEAFKSMLVFDALIFNEDRHMGNYGIMRKNTSGDLASMAPIFDNNLSLFTGAMPDELQVPRMLEKASHGKGAFTPSLDEQAALVIGSVQKEQLARLEGFTFERHPVMDLFSQDDSRNYFSDERLECLTAYVQKRAHVLLTLPTVSSAKIMNDVGVWQ